MEKRKVFTGEVNAVSYWLGQGMEIKEGDILEARYWLNSSYFDAKDFIVTKKHLQAVRRRGYYEECL